MESHADSDQLERVSEEHGYRACNTQLPQKTRNSNTRTIVPLTRESTGGKPPNVRLIRMSWHQELQRITRAVSPLAGNPFKQRTHMVNLVIGHKLNRRIGKDPDQSRRMALEKSQNSTLPVNLRTGTKRSTPCPGILLEVRVRGLEEDLDPV